MPKPDAHHTPLPINPSGKLRIWSVGLGTLAGLLWTLTIIGAATGADATRAESLLLIARGLAVASGVAAMICWVGAQYCAWTALVADSADTRLDDLVHDTGVMTEAVRDLSVRVNATAGQLSASLEASTALIETVAAQVTVARQQAEDLGRVTAHLEREALVARQQTADLAEVAKLLRQQAEAAADLNRLITLLEPTRRSRPRPSRNAAPAAPKQGGGPQQNDGAHVRGDKTEAEWRAYLAGVYDQEHRD